LSYA
jgi:insulysin